jgi:hypothetical protein
LPDEVYGWHIGGHTGSVVEAVYNKIDPWASPEFELL